MYNDQLSYLIYSLTIIIGFIGSFDLPVKSAAVPYSAINSSVSYEKTTSDSLLLTKQKVKDWLHTRIAVAKLQKQMKNNASSYDNVVQEFYAKRTDLLQSKGWAVDEFDAVKKRIQAAIAAMDISEELEESRADHEKEIADIRENSFYSDEQKQELINALSKIREQKRAQFIEPTKPDWPVVKPYRSVFRKMTSWIAGNSSTIPVIE